MKPVILVVDDIERNTNQIEIYLKRIEPTPNSFEILKFKNGVDAYKAFEAKAQDSNNNILLVTDIQMASSNGNGPEKENDGDILIQKIREYEKKNNRQPIVIFINSAWGTEKDPEVIAYNVPLNKGTDFQFFASKTISPPLLRQALTLAGIEVKAATPSPNPSTPLKRDLSTREQEVEELKGNMDKIKNTLNSTTFNMGIFSKNTEEENLQPQSKKSKQGKEKALEDNTDPKPTDTTKKS